MTSMAENSTQGESETTHEDTIEEEQSINDQDFPYIDDSTNVSDR